MKMKILKICTVFCTACALGAPNYAWAEIITPQARTQPQEEQTAKPSPARRGAGGKHIEGLDEKLTLERCIEIALENSPSIISARLAVATAEVNVSLSKSRFLPTASAGAQQGYDVTKVPGSSRTDHGTTSSYIEASLSISGITDLAREVKVSKLALEQAKLSLDKTEPEIYDRLVKHIFNSPVEKLRKKGVYVVAIPSVIDTVPEWLRPYLDISTMTNKVLSKIYPLLKSLGIKIGKNSKRAYKSNMLQF